MRVRPPPSPAPSTTRGRTASSRTCAASPRAGGATRLAARGLRRDRAPRRLRLLGPGRRRRLRAAADPGDLRHPLPQPHGPRRAGRARPVGRLADASRRRARRPPARRAAGRARPVARGGRRGAPPGALARGPAAVSPGPAARRLLRADLPGRAAPRAVPRDRRGARDAFAPRRPSLPCSSPPPT